MIKYPETDIDFDNERNQEYLKPLESNIICPKMKTSGKPNNRKNWNTIQCVIRINENNRCTFRCEIAKKIIATAKKLQVDLKRLEREHS